MIGYEIPCRSCNGIGEVKGGFFGNTLCPACDGRKTTKKGDKCPFKSLGRLNGSSNIFYNVNAPCMEDDCVFWNTVKEDCNIRIFFDRGDKNG